MSRDSRTKFTILGMLSLSPASGYEITKRIKSSTNYFWSESEGQIYPTLAKCVQEELIVCDEEKTGSKQRLKKTYSITKKGEAALIAWLKQEPKATLVRNELLLKLFFGGNIDIEHNIYHLMHYQKKLEKEISTYEKIREEIVTKNKKSPHLKFWLMTLDYGIKSANIELLWCIDSLKLLQK